MIALNPSVNFTKLEAISNAPSICSAEFCESQDANNLIKFFSNRGVNLITL